MIAIEEVEIVLSKQNSCELFCFWEQIQFFYDSANMCVDNPKFPFFSDIGEICISGDNQRHNQNIILFIE